MVYFPIRFTQWPTTAWAPFAFCGPQLSASCVAPSRTVGFIGFGRIAQATLARLVPFGYKECLYITRSTTSRDAASDARLAQELSLDSVRRATLDEIAAASDVLFVLAPGGPATHHMINEAFLKKMKKTAVLVNTARGTLVDSDALSKALDAGWIYAAGLDVVEGEPNIGLDHPLVKHPRYVACLAYATAISNIVLDVLSCRTLEARRPTRALGWPSWL